MYRSPLEFSFNKSQPAAKAIKNFFVGKNSEQKKTRNRRQEKKNKIVANHHHLYLIGTEFFIHESLHIFKSSI